MKKNSPHHAVVLGLVLVTISGAVAFSPASYHGQVSRSTCLQASRRDCLGFAATAAVTALFPAAPARADLDYGRIQDLMKDQSPEVYAPASTPTGTGRPKYLTEPTEEFKENERKSSEFKREQLLRKQEFVKVLDKLQTDPNDENALAGDLDQLRELVRANSGLPLGINKQEVVKQVRRRKAKKFWPTGVEIAYQDLLMEISYMQSPNTERDPDNPL